MTAPIHRFAREDDGAYAVLYAVTLVLFVAFAAVVVDLNSARWDRRIDRLAADGGALGAVTHLESGAAKNVLQACTKAWAFLEDNTAGLTMPAGACDPFLGYAAATTCPGSQIDATAPSGEFTVTMSWPIPDDSPLMKSPDIRPGNVTQPMDSDFDGTDPCERFGVSVSRQRSFIFAPAMDGPAGTTTLVHSVARAAPKGESGNAAVALLVLERTECLAIDIQGSSGASVLVRGNGDRPGMIHSDSLGNGSTCTGSDKVIDGDFGTVGDPANPPRIWAEDAETGTPLAPGLIGVVALSGASGAQPTNAHDPSPDQVYAEGQPGGAPIGRPLLGRGAVDERYRLPVKDTIEEARGLWNMTATDASAAGYDVLGCSPVGSSNAALRVFVDCPTGITYKDFAFTGPGAVIVYNGPVTVEGSSGTLSFTDARKVYVKGGASGIAVKTNLHVNTGGQPTCADRFADNRLVKTKLVVGNGPFVGGGNAALRMCQTSVVMADDDGSCPIPSSNGVPPYNNTCDGFFEMRGNGGLDWSAPNAAATPPTPADLQELEDLALWTETSNPAADRISRVEGNGFIKMAGVFFLPNADPFRIAGKGGQDIGENAQFIARRLEVAGNGHLNMRPDPNDVVLFPYFGGITLIR
jgi:hypothetical protein